MVFAIFIRRDDDVALALLFTVNLNTLVWYRNVSQAADQPKEILEDWVSLRGDMTDDTDLRRQLQSSKMGKGVHQIWEC